jgi:hypothetical protein
MAAMARAKMIGAIDFQRIPKAWTRPPTMGARPVLLYESDGRRQWGLYHNGAWRGGQNYQDSFTGQKQWRLDGTLINNPVRWSSS